MLDNSARRIAAPVLNATAGMLQSMGVHANTVTAIGFIFGLAGIAAIALDGHLLGLLLLAVNRFADGVDGALARRTQETNFGGFLDAAFRPIIYAGVPFGFAVAHPTDALGAVFLVLGLTAALATQLAARFYMIARPVNFRAWPFSPIITENTEIFLCFALMCLMPPAFTPFAFFFGFLCFISAGMYVAAASGNNTPPPAR